MILDEFDNLADLWRTKVVYWFARVRDSLHVGLLVGTGILLYILAKNAQVREIFKVILESEDPLQWSTYMAALAAFFLSLLLFFIYHASLPEIDEYEFSEGFLWKAVGILGGYFVTLAPWVGAGVAIFFLGEDLEIARGKIVTLLSELSDSARFEGNKSLVLIDLVMGRINRAIAFISASMFMTVVVIELWRHFRRSIQGLSFISVLIKILAGSILVGLVVKPSVLDVPWGTLFEMMGPLTTSCLVAISFFTLGIFISWAAHKSGMSAIFGFSFLFATWLLLNYFPSFPIGYFVAFVLSVTGILVSWGAKRPPLLRIFGILIAFLCGTFSILLYQFRNSDDTNSTKKDMMAPPANIDILSKKWLTDRQKVHGKKPVPFIIVSAQGGGIYAAAVSTLVLSRLQDRKPTFNRYLFTISGVSGGAIGSVFYQALSRQSKVNCPVEIEGNKTSFSRSFENCMTPLLLDKYLSPIIGQLPADVIWKMVFGNKNRHDRSDALREKLLTNLPSLGDHYTSHWSADKEWPSLILNSTWTSNGHRVAFAPFSLSEIGDGTLWSFKDLFVDQGVYFRGKPFAPKIVDAAVTSARFPAISPPLTLTVEDRLFNFSDGGYADATGVTTALEVFNAVKEIAANNEKKPIELVPRLLMITYDFQSVDPKNENGTWFVDSWAPIKAILGVRKNLSRQAVERALKADKKNAAPQVLQISVNPNDFGIALGWRLSRTSYEILSLLVGRPEWCPAGTLITEESNSVLKNSCILKEILNILPKTPAKEIASTLNN